MVVNENEESLAPRGVLGLFASKLSPTGWDYKMLE
jgi:hypothetical protein